MSDDCLKYKQGENLNVRMKEAVQTLRHWLEHGEILEKRLSDNPDLYWQSCEYFICKIEKMKEAVK